MGLDVSHDAFSGAYSSFNRFRQAVAKAMGGSFPPHETEYHEDGDNLEPDMWYWGTDYGPETHPGLSVFLSHSDCDGEISSDDCVKVANEIEALLPKLEAMGIGSGHIERDGGYGAVARKFIAGCKDAAESGEPLVFG
jgi:hypothetical protein